MLAQYNELTKFKIAEVSEHFVKGLALYKEFYEHVKIVEVFFLVMSLYTNNINKRRKFKVAKKDIRAIARKIYTLKNFALPVQKIKEIANYTFNIDDYSLNLYTCKDLGDSLEISINKYFLENLKYLHLRDIGMFPVITNNRVMDILLYKQYTTGVVNMSLRELCNLAGVHYVAGNWQAKYDRLYRAFRHAEPKFVTLPSITLDKFKELYFSNEVLNWELVPLDK